MPLWRSYFLNRTRVKTIIDAFPNRTILVLGDLMLDEFIWGKVRRISPEAPVPVVEVTAQTYSLGGAGNVAANIRALGGMPILVGVIGDDNAADVLLNLMEKDGMDVSGLIREKRPTTLKTRIVAHNQQVVRADRESREPLKEASNAALVTAFLKHLVSVNAVIVSDYDKSVVNPQLLKAVLHRVREAGIPVFLDPKVYHADYYRPITLITPNHREAELLVGASIDTPAQLENAGRELLKKFDCEYALITRGEEGMSLFSKTRSQHLPTVAREVFDVSGAGDTVIATLALAHAAGGAMEESAVLANHAAGIVVGKVGTATVNPEELLAEFESHHAHSAD
jgi:D-glycero-beta-D-manno-heptose-7-phosphate kinase